MVELQPSKLLTWVRFPSPAPMKNKINRLYADLKTFEQNLMSEFDTQQRDQYLKKLDLLEYQALKISVSKSLSSEYYSLRTSIDYVRNCLNRGAYPYQLQESIDPSLQ